MGTGSDKFGLLLAHFFGSGTAGLSAAGAAGLYGLGVETARSAMELLESEGILRSTRRGRGRRFSADTGSEYYLRSRAAYAVRRRRLN